jgi:hypothetical protein
MDRQLIPVFSEFARWICQLTPVFSEFARWIVNSSLFFLKLPDGSSTHPCFFLNLLDGKDMGGGRILKVRFAESQAVIKVQELFTIRESSTVKLAAGDSEPGGDTVQNMLE